MKVLVLWADPDSANLGVRALAEGAAHLAFDALPDAQVKHVNFGRGESGRFIGGRSLLADIGRRNGPVKQLLREADVILDTGAGDSFSDIYGIKRFAVIWYVQFQAHRIPSLATVFAPQTVGPFRSRFVRRAAGWTLRRFDLVMARDLRSGETSGQLGRRPDVVSSDMVFALPVPMAQEQRSAVVNVSGLLWNGDGHGSSDVYREQVQRLCAGLSTRGYRLSLLAHVLDNPTADNDVMSISEVARMFPDCEVVVPTSLDEARGVLAGADVVVGARMHACLNALSSGTPAIAWAYSRKFEPLLREIEWEHCVDLRRTVSAADETLAILDQTGVRELKAQAELSQAIGRARLAAAVSALAGMGVSKSHG